MHMGTSATGLLRPPAGTGRRGGDERGTPPHRSRYASRVVMHVPNAEQTAACHADFGPGPGTAESAATGTHALFSTVDDAEALFAWGPPPPPSLLEPEDPAALTTGGHSTGK